MRADLTIKPPHWMIEPSVRILMRTLNHDDVNALFVGGCIRNELMGNPVKDIDIACKFTPEQTIEILNKAGIKTIPTGIKYGTVTAIINDKSFEITSLRSDINTDGRHADVSFGANWTDDARRRDFTINALYADMDGHIYDPLGTGLNDIQTRTVRFIGDANQRIIEDTLRILRYFRFYGQYGHGKIDTQSINACQKFKGNVDTLSNERVADELTKIMSHDGCVQSFKAMQSIGLFEIKSDTIDALQTLVALQNQLQSFDLYSRIYLINTITKYFNNNALNKFFNKLNELKNWWYNTDEYHIPTALYIFGRTITVQGLMILKSQNQNVTDIQIATAISNPIPIMPVTASDIMQQFHIDEGPTVGKYLKTAEQIWIESKLTLKTQDILSRL